jgi:hypothetical protein
MELMSLVEKSLEGTNYTIFSTYNGDVCVQISEVVFKISPKIGITCFLVEGTRLIWDHDLLLSGGTSVRNGSGVFPRTRSLLNICIEAIA